MTKHLINYCQIDWYEDELKKEIEQDRLAHGKKPLKNKNDYQPPASGGNSSENLEASEEIPSGVKTQKSSITDPESGQFRKGEHKHVFAYAVETACDQHGWERYIEKAEDDLTPKTRENITLEELMKTWMAKLNDNCIFISAREKINMDELKTIIYNKVRELHVQKYPYNDFLYQTYDEE